MSGALVPSGASGTTFAQQGSVDWVSLSTSTLSFSVEVLSRFSKAGVEMITVAIGQALFSKFNVPPEGQQRVTDAVAKLKAFSSYGKVLWFGFGVKHIVRTLCETEQGATCAAICACLSVSYDSFFASKVLKALTDESMTPATLTPALSQWGALINVCSGAVGDSQFPILVEGFSRLIGQDSSTTFRRLLHTPTTAKALAGALQELSKVSNGTLRSVTFEGGIDCGWLAAVAQWLLSLRVEIVDSSGTCLYSNFPGDNLYAQVILIRHDTALSETQETKTISRSYFVPPGRLCFRLLDHTVIQDVPLTHIYSVGQSEWDSILDNTFNEAANRLIRTGIKLAEFLCSGLHDTSQRQTMNPFNPRGEAYLENDYQRKRAFLSFSARRLPELMSIWQAAEVNQERVYGYKSSSSAPYSSKVLTEICSCSKCTFGSILAKETSFCLHRVGVTLFKFLWILSWLDIDPSIKPSNTGLLMIYYTSIYGNEDPNWLMRSMGKCCLSTDLTSLFTGSNVAEKTPADASAICDGGICIFNATLKNPTDAPSQVVRRRVVLGHIERSGFLYRQISDKVRNQEAYPELDALPKLPYIFGPSVNLKFVIEKTINSRTLEATFDIETEVAANDFLGPFSHEHTYKSYDYTRLRQGRFGPNTLRNEIMDRVCVESCVARQVAISSSKRVDEPSVPWTGKCSQATSTLWTNHEGNIECCPRQGEWVLRQELDCCMGLLRGSYALLYSILCQLRPSTAISLSYISSCLICSIPILRYDVRGNLTAVLPRSLTICSMLESSSVQFELVSSMNWREGVHRPCAGAATAQSESFSFEKSRSYTFVKRNVLEQILDRRGILFKKRATKLDIIKMLQDYDAKNPDAANDKVLLDSEDDDGLDVSMEDASCLVTPQMT